jgi:hypothetical protein
LMPTLLTMVTSRTVEDSLTKVKKLSNIVN